MASVDAKLKSANKYITQVNKAISECESAIRQLGAALAAVQENWQGDAGSAMAAALNERITEIGTAKNLLEIAVVDMRSSASNLEAEAVTEAEKDGHC